MNRLGGTAVAVAGALALALASPAGAQNQGASKDTRTVAPKPQIKAEELVGGDIRSLKGDRIGEIESVIIDGQGNVAAVIVEVGGFLGLGERIVALDWNDLTYHRGGEIIQTGMTEDQLKNLPEYRYADDANRRRAFVDERYAAGRQAAGRPGAVESEWVKATGLRTSKLIGADVVNPQGEDIGDVSEVIIDNGRPMLVLSVGEFLGLGGHEAAVPLDQVTVWRERDDADDLRVTLEMSKAAVQALPRFDAESWRRSGRIGQR